MKKWMRIFPLLVLALIVLCATVLAADAPTEAGIYNLTSTGVTVTPQTAAGDTITGVVQTIGDASTTFYAGAEKLTLTYGNATADSYYLTLMLSGEESYPTESNLSYIDQTTASGNTVTFTLFPNKLESGKTYCIYLSSNDATEGKISNLTQVASFQYYTPYKLGDVDDSGEITATDALWTLELSVGSRVGTESQKLAADVDKSGALTATDALWILEASVGKRALSQ